MEEGVGAMIVHAYHGWASDASIWNSIIDPLGSDVTFKCYERGYFGPARTLDDDENPDVVVAHSMGLFFIPMQVLQTARTLVFANSFCHFPSRDPQSMRRTLMQLNQMRTHLTRNAERQVDLFRAKSAMTRLEPPRLFMTETLCDDLDLLAQADLGPHQVAPKAKITFLHSDEDPIVSAAAIAETVRTFHGARHHFVKDSTHNLPFTAADALRSLILDT